MNLRVFAFMSLLLLLALPICWLPFAAADSQALPLDQPAWKFELPSGWGVLRVLTSGDMALVDGGSGIIALDAGSHAARWQAIDKAYASAIVVTKDSVLYGTPAGAVVSRELLRGNLRWPPAAVCTANIAPLGGIEAILDDGANLIVGCQGGRVVRIDAASGRIRATSNFDVGEIFKIVSLGSCAYGITALAAGPNDVSDTEEILDCQQLLQIAPEQHRAEFLGAVGNAAVLDDRSWDAAHPQRPASIFLVNLSTGKATPKIDLDPSHHFGETPHSVSQGSTAILQGDQLYLALDGGLYWCGDPRALFAVPKRIASIVDSSAFVYRSGLVQVSSGDARVGIEQQIVRLQKDHVEVVWSDSVVDSNFGLFHDTIEPDLPSIVREDLAKDGHPRFLRIEDASQLLVDGSCHFIAFNQKTLIQDCTARGTDGKMQWSIALYNWPQPQALNTR